MVLQIRKKNIKVFRHTIIIRKLKENLLKGKTNLAIFLNPKYDVIIIYMLLLFFLVLFRFVSLRLDSFRCVAFHKCSFSFVLFIMFLFWSFVFSLLVYCFSFFLLDLFVFCCCCYVLFFFSAPFSLNGEVKHQLIYEEHFCFPFSKHQVPMYF